MKIGIKDINIGNRYRKNIGDLTDLCDSIKLQGLLQPIGITKDKSLVFGQRRVEAYKILGLKDIECKIVDVTSIVEGEFDENRIRKEFTYSEMIAIAEAVKTEIGNRQGNRIDQLVVLGPQVKGIKTRDIAAEKAGFSSTNEYRRAKEVITKGSPELVKAMEDKTIDITSAAKISKMSEPEQKVIVKQIVSGEAKSVGHALAKQREEAKVERAKQVMTTYPIVTCEDYKTWLYKQKQADLIITDPPYMTEFKGKNFGLFVQDMLIALESRVKPTGSMYVCIGGYPSELQAYLNANTHIKLQSVLIWTYNNAIGPQSDKQYIQNYQCVLYYRYQDSKLLGESINDKLASFTINAPDGRQGDRYHTWQKPDALAERLISNSSKPGDLVLDPFTCTGTFILTANRLGRIGLGCDISKKNLDIAIKRGCKYE